MYFYLTYSGLKGMSIADFEILTLRRIDKFMKMMQQQKEREEREIQEQRRKAAMSASKGRR